ncbi:UbiA prenyltransferase family protein [candidate division WOR-3 bacterium]|nr:UbiA prenyltransferase family protein [candidate division WOR-3 bacterium]
MKGTAALIEELRPKQWIKNIFVFAALVFTRKFTQLEPSVLSFSGFFAFLGASSFVYVVNDIIDLKKDRLHPVKSKRPIASGRIKPLSAFIFVLALLFLTNIPWIYFSHKYGVLDWKMPGAVAAYTMMTLAYSLWLKKVVIVDVMIIALGFVIRAVGGAFAIDVPISSWFLITVLLLSLFLGLIKRRQEIFMERNESHREVLKHYTKELLDQMIIVVASATIVTYAIYTAEKKGAILLPYSTIFVIYGIFRYLFVVHLQKEGEMPEKVIYSDRPFLVNLLLYSIFVILTVIIDPEVFK